MFKLYRNVRAVERSWIRNHPVQYVALNALVFAAGIGYIKYQDRKDKREIENEIAQQDA